MRTKVGYPGVGLVFAGAILILLSFTTFNWYPGSTGANSVADITFSDLHDNLAAFDAPAASTSYFGWIAWLLLLLSILVGLAANLPTKYVDGLRVTGFAIGLTGFAWTYYALAQYLQAQKDRGGAKGASVFTNADPGIWMALAGFVLCAAGAALGPLPWRAIAPPGHAVPDPDAGPVPATADHAGAAPRPRPRPRPQPPVPPGGEI